MGITEHNLIQAHKEALLACGRLVWSDGIDQEKGGELMVDGIDMMENYQDPGYIIFFT